MPPVAFPPVAVPLVVWPRVVLSCAVLSCAVPSRVALSCAVPSRVALSCVALSRVALFRAVLLLVMAFRIRDGGNYMVRATATVPRHVVSDPIPPAASKAAGGARSVVRYVVLWALACFFLLPVYVLVVTSFKDPVDVSVT